MCPSSWERRRRAPGGRVGAVGCKGKRGAKAAEVCTRAAGRAALGAAFRGRQGAGVLAGRRVARGYAKGCEEAFR